MNSGGFGYGGKWTFIRWKWTAGIDYKSGREMDVTTLYNAYEYYESKKIETSSQSLSK